MLPVSSINSQNINFGRSKKTEDNPEEKKPRHKKPSIKGFGGGKSMAEKYGDIPLTTKTAKIILGDNIIDHALEFGITTAAFLGMFIKGKKSLSGSTGAFIDSAAKNANKQNGAGILNSFKKYTGKVWENLQDAKEGKTINLADGLEENKAINSTKEVLQDSVIEKIANKADDEKSLIYKIANSKMGKKIILGNDRNTVAAKVEADELKKYFAQRLGITRGADICDTAVATTGGVIAAKIANFLTDAGTDLNDSAVAEKARKALEGTEDKDGNTIVVTSEELEAYAGEKQRQREQRLFKLLKTI